MSSVLRSPQTPVPLVQFSGVSHQFGSTSGVTVLTDLTLTCHEGEFIAVVGPSGCGKSTLLNMVAGLLRPATGSVVYRGERVEAINRRVGYVTQKDNMMAWRTTLENVTIALELRGVPVEERQARGREIIRRVGLAGFEDHYPDQLSGGMRQRVNIARALIYEPEMLLMDEPFGALDALTRLRLQAQLLDLWVEKQKTVLFVTHDLVEAITLADRVVVMSARPGRIVANMPVPLPRPRNVYHIHREAQFQVFYDEIWEYLRAEVEGDHA